jgi:hypothetical protein
LKDYLLKDAASILGINYSTAKTILRIFRLEKRIEKKNSDEVKDNQPEKTSSELTHHNGKSAPNETEDTNLQQTELNTTDPKSMLLKFNLQSLLKNLKMTPHSYFSKTKLGNSMAYLTAV